MKIIEITIKGDKKKQTVMVPRDFVVVAMDVKDAGFCNIELMLTLAEYDAELVPREFYIFETGDMVEGERLTLVASELYNKGRDRVSLFMSQ